MVLTPCGWLWIAVDRCQLFVSRCGSFLTVLCKISTRLTQFLGNSVSWKPQLNDKFQQTSHDEKHFRESSFLLYLFDIPERKPNISR